MATHINLHNPEALEGLKGANQVANELTPPVAVMWGMIPLKGRERLQNSNYATWSRPFLRDVTKSALGDWRTQQGAGDARGAN